LIAIAGRPLATQVPRRSTPHVRQLRDGSRSPKDDLAVVGADRRRHPAPPRLIERLGRLVPQRRQRDHQELDALAAMPRTIRSKS
jgi:hypothetical protein